MPITFKDIEVVDNGARFYNVDIHVHSMGASHDVTDPAMTVEAIIDEAAKQEIAILSITDHNSDQNVEGAVQYAQKYAGRLLFLPGVEITTANGHLLVYFAPEKAENVRDLLARINLVGRRGERDTHTSMSMADVLREVDGLGGVGLAAHIDADKGFEAGAHGYPAWKRDIVLSPGLYGVEIADPAKLAWYSDDDPGSDGSERRKLLVARSLEPATSGRPGLAHFQGSDAHDLNAFVSRNGTRTLTRVKMNELTFEAFRTALVDPGARVRAVATIPRAFPRVRGMHVTGGFLDGEIYHFSDNLNCFIGGRGTGKSTALKIVSYGLGLSNELEEYDNAPGTVIVYCEDAAGILYRYERRPGSSPIVKAKEDESIHDVPQDAFRVEFYGQGDLAEVAKDPLKNPAVLQEFLDRHIVLHDLMDRERELVTALAENSAQLIPVEGRFSQLSAAQKDAKDLDQKLKIAEEGKLREIAALQSQLTAEKNLRGEIEAVRRFYVGGLSLSNFLRDYADIAAAVGPITNDKQSKIHLEAIRLEIEATNAYLNKKEAEINTELKTAAKRLEVKLETLRQNQGVLDGQLAEKITELQKKGLTGSVNDLNSLVARRSALTKTIASINAQRPMLEQLRADRKRDLQELKRIREEIITRRKTQLQSINKHLARTVQDYIVFIHFEPAGIIDGFKEFILDTMQGTHFPDQTAERLCSATTPEELADLVLQSNEAVIAKAGNTGGDWARQILSLFRTWANLHAMEVLWKQPKPVIVVRTKGPAAEEIPVNQLSDGQRHTILLTIAMFAESSLPLIIDQPEDDLDNAFIFSTVVSTLRAIKERRQVIMVTHNANIAVLGDAELLLPMKRSADKGQAFDRGAIDKAATKTAVKDILEGGEVAFLRRRAIYGY